MKSATTARGDAIQAALSEPRMSTYLAWAAGDPGLALELYGWNARVSSALMLPAHFAEVVVRNAVSEALTSAYGVNWPWSQVFEGSLPSARFGFDSRRHVTTTRSREQTTGKVIAELKFVFWQKMFTSRHDVRLWDEQLESLFPNAGVSSTAELRGRIYDDLEAIRQIRNRMAHHEPVFARALDKDFDRMLELIRMRSSETASWVHSIETVSEILAAKPGTEPLDPA